VTGWADMLDFCVTFPARLVSAVKQVAYSFARQQSKWQ
jgi:hypothetical protein